MESDEQASTTSSRRYDASRRQAEARARRRRILDAARALFLDEGFGRTSVERIAVEAGVSVQTVYAAFGSKPGILAAVVDVAVAGDDEDRSLQERLDSSWLAEERDPRRWVRRVAGFAREIHARSAEVLHLVASVSGSDPALQELEDRLRDARRVDTSFGVEVGPLDPAAVGRTADEVADLLLVLAGPEIWTSLVVHRGWSPERYEDWLARLLERELVPAGDG